MPHSINAVGGVPVTPILSGSDKPIVDSCNYHDFYARCETTNKLGTYNPKNDERYPLRNLKNQPLHILRVFQIPGGPDYQLSIDQVDKTIRDGGWKALHKCMKWEPITKDNIIKNQEAGLIGQYGVKTYVGYKKGDIMGIYSGVVVPVEIVSPLSYSPYVMVSKGCGYAIDGDGIVSRIGTNLICDENGTPIKQALDGYNCDIETFLAEVRGLEDETADVCLYCLYATEDIPLRQEGTELKLNYRLNEEGLRALVQNQSRSHPTSRALLGRGKRRIPCNLL